MNRREVACIGKLAFNTFGHASKAAERSRRGRTEHRQQAYHCLQCGKFHVGTSESPRIRKQRVTGEGE